MRIITAKQVNVLGWIIVVMFCAIVWIEFTTDNEIFSAVSGLGVMGCLCLSEVLRRSKPGQRMLSNWPKLLPENKFLRWAFLLASGILIIDWVWEIGRFLLS